MAVYVVAWAELAGLVVPVVLGDLVARGLLERHTVEAQTWGGEAIKALKALKVNQAQKVLTLNMRCFEILF